MEANSENMWGECPFRKKVRQVLTHVGGSRHRGASWNGDVFLPLVQNGGYVEMKADVTVFVISFSQIFGETDMLISQL